MIAATPTLRHQQIRVQRLGMAGVAYALQALIAVAAAWLGTVDWATVALFVVGLTTIIVGFYGVFRSNFNLRFAEPNLSVSQLLCPLVPAFYLLAHIESLPARTGVLLTVVVPLLYGMLDLSIRRFVVVALAYLLCYAGVFALHVRGHPASDQAQTEWLVLIMLAMLLVQIGVIGSFINGLRHTMRRKNDGLAGAMHQIREMAVRDNLTGIFNRRHVMQALKSEAARTTRNGSLFSVCLVDLDSFTQINDEHGYKVGDRILAEVADTINTPVRDIDTLGRFAGEKFLLILPVTDLTAAAQVAERLRTQISQLQFVDDAGIDFGVTVSIGVAACQPETIVDTGALLRRADHALYRSKVGGRAQSGRTCRRRGLNAPPGACRTQGQSTAPVG